MLTDSFVIARPAKARFYDFTSLQPTRKLVRTLRLEGTGPVAMQMRVEARPEYGGSEVDAASLLAFTSDFLEPGLARSTRERIEEKLGAGDLLYRNEDSEKTGRAVSCSAALG